MFNKLRQLLQPPSDDASNAPPTVSADEALLAALALNRPRTAYYEATLPEEALCPQCQSVLVATGQPAAAVAFGAVAGERSRRRSALLMLGRQQALEGQAVEGSGLEGPGADLASPGVGVSGGRTRRLPEE